MSFDIHAHYISQEFLELIEKPGSVWHTELQKRGEQTWVIHEQGYAYPLVRGFYDSSARLADMARMKVDMAAVSAAPQMFYYWAEPKLGLQVARLTNDGIHRLTQEHSGKFLGMGTLPMQDLDLAIRELRRCVDELGFRAIMIGSNVEGVQFDDPRFLPFFKECESRRVFVFFHPYISTGRRVFTKYYLTNLYGNPMDTAMAIASLIFGGVLEKCPGLKVGFPHGGGFFPYQLGRLEHGYEMRSEPKVNGARSPERYLNQLYFDSIVFKDKQLRFLVDVAGADHVMLGTDYAFDMGMSAPVDFIQGAGLPPAQTQAILGENARKVFGL
jgi:aminocarboxymuconate-semialdehyde decarboxylase